MNHLHMVPSFPENPCMKSMEPSYHHLTSYINPTCLEYVTVPLHADEVNPPLTNLINKSIAAF